MRSNGLATILLLIPVLTVPALAIFGVPQIGFIQDFNFGETQENARESRAGRSSKRQQDDSFTELEGFTREADSKEEASGKSRDTFFAESNARTPRSRLKNEAKVVGWDDESDLDQLNQSTRPAPMNAADGESFDDPTDSAPLPPSGKKTVIIDKSSRQSKRQPATVKSDEPARSSDAADDTDQKVIQARFDEESEPEKPKTPARVRRSRAKDASVAKPREEVEKPLTLQSAIERLNELDVRNFRLESGREAGQYIFVCSYAPADTPRVSYRFEAEADEPMKAVQKVLDQIVEWQRQRQ
jgi:hypothetical protein